MKPRYCPRDFCLEPAGFGKVQAVRWRQGDDEYTRALIRAAQLQHLYAVRIRHSAMTIQRRNRQAAEANSHATGTVDAPLRTLASKMGCSYARLMRCLRGEIVMRLDDIAWADLVLKDVSELSRAKPAATVAQQRHQTPRTR